MSVDRSTIRRLTTFAGVVVVCVVASIVYVVYARERDERPAAGAPPLIESEPETVEQFTRAPHLVFRSTAYGSDYGRVELATADDPQGARLVTDLECDRVAFGGGRGICLKLDRGVITTASAVIFDREFHPVDRLSVEGLPSRASVSRSGRWAASTSFVSGDSYAAASFSTRTWIYDLDTNETVANLESFAAYRDGERFESVDFNYWGVTFADDDNTFFATLGTGSHRYLVQGDIAQRTITVLRDGVECPSLSPDGTRIAFKERVGGGSAVVSWRLAVLDLATMDVTTLAETRNVDDQAAWLDDEQVIYGIPESPTGGAVTNTWRIPADGTGAPALLVGGSWSTIVVAGADPTREG